MWLCGFSQKNCSHLLDFYAARSLTAPCRHLLRSYHVLSSHQPLPRLLLAAALISIVSGTCGVLLVSQINTALTVERHSAALAWTFAGLAVAAMLSRTLSSVLFERLCQLGEFLDLRVYWPGAGRRRAH